MNIFTQGQKQRVVQALSLSPRRIRLVECSRNTINPPESKTLLVSIRTQRAARQYTIQTLFKDTQDIQIEVFDRLGHRLLVDTKRQQNSGFLYDLNLSSYATGVYIIKISTRTEVQVRRLVVID